MNILRELDVLYYLLRDNAFPGHANEIKRLIYFLNKDDKAGFFKAYKSNLIWGGAGSIVDIDFRDKEKNKKKREILNKIKVYKKSISKPWWKFW